MDDAEYSIKPDEYEPDLFNDMSVQEEITVGSSENIVNSYSNPSTDHDFGSSGTNSGNTIVRVLNPSALGNQSAELRNKPKVIYIKSGVGGNLVNNSIKTVKLPNNFKQLKVIPISKFNQDSNRIIQLNQNATPIGTSNVPRLLNHSIIRNGIQVTKLNNFNLTKIPSGQKILIANRPGVQYGKVTPINYVQSAGVFQQQQGSGLSVPISLPLGTQTVHPVQLQLHPHGHGHSHSHQTISTSQSAPVPQTALKLEPGDSGFYNLTGGNGPTRYYPRMHSPDKDSLDGSQEQMANVYKTNGLRKYARSVCDKVKEKGTTTYSEVADELVHEYAAEHPMIPAQQLHYIQKNIRRRVYDALNVLMALKVLDKEKKEIKWKGLPVNLLEECKQLEEEKMRKTELLQQRVEELSELVLQLISYKNLVGRNRQREKECNAPQANERIKLPFLVITTNNSTIIDCNISPEKLEYLFTFDQPFEMQDEFQTLKQSGFTLRLGTSQCTESQYKRCLELVPNTLRFYVEAIYQQRPAIVPDFLSLHRRNMAAAAQARSNKNNNLSSSCSSSINIGSSYMQQSHGFHHSSHTNPHHHSQSQSLHQQPHHHSNSGGSSSNTNNNNSNNGNNNNGAGGGTGSNLVSISGVNSNSNNQSYWGGDQSPIYSGTSSKRYNPGASDSSQKYRLNISGSGGVSVGSHQMSHHGGYGSVSGTVTGGSAGFDLNTKYISSHSHDLEDEIEVMDEEADFPSD